jgi:hypothetical protein
MALVSSKEEAERLAYNSFLKLLRNKDEILSDNLELIQMFSELLNINIYLVSNLSKDVYIPNSEYPLFIEDKYTLLYQNSNKKSIILINYNDGLQFNTLSFEKKTTFNGDIFNLKKRLYHKRTDNYFDKKVSNYNNAINTEFQIWKWRHHPQNQGDFGIVNYQWLDEQIKSIRKTLKKAGYKSVED